MRRRTLIGLSVLILAGLAAAVAVAYWMTRDMPDAVDINTARDNVSEPDAPGDESLVLDGTWRVSSTNESFAGVRIQEELRGIGSVTAVLRTPDVSGDATIVDGQLTELTVTLDMTTLTSDDPRRDRNIATALNFAQHPTAAFVLDTAVDVSRLNDGAQITFDTPGTLTINGVSRTVVAAVTVDTTVGALVAVAQVPVTFSDFSVILPSAPIVLSIAADGIVETQLRFLPN